MQPSYWLCRPDYIEGTQDTWHLHKIRLVFMPYPTGNKFSSEVKFGYLAYVKFVKFGTLLDFQNFFNNCLYNSQS